MVGRQAGGDESFQQCTAHDAREHRTLGEHGADHRNELRHHEALELFGVQALGEDGLLEVHFQAVRVRAGRFVLAELGDLALPSLAASALPLAHRDGEGQDLAPRLHAVLALGLVMCGWLGRA